MKLREHMNAWARKAAGIALLLALPVGSAWASSAVSAEDSIKANIERYTQGKVRVDHVAATPARGIWQVTSEHEIFYVDGTGRYGLVNGSLVDMQEQKDLTALALQKLTAVDFDRLPLHLAIRQVRGNGQRRVAIFEDPNCPICRAFAKFIDQLDDVTVYRFMFPVISPQSQQAARLAWCSTDRAAAWNEAMAGRMPTGDGNCDVNGLIQILQFGEKQQIRNTPTVFLGNGKRLVGATPPDQFMAELAASAQPGR